MLKQSWPRLSYLCAPITETPFAELVRLSRISIADEMRKEHRRRTRTGIDRLRQTKAAGSGGASPTVNERIRSMRRL